MAALLPLPRLPPPAASELQVPHSLHCHTNHIFTVAPLPSISCTHKLQPRTSRLKPQQQIPHQQKLGSKHKYLSDDHPSFANKVINECTHDGSFVDTIRSYIELLQRGLPPPNFGFFPRLIKAFGLLSDIDKARQMYGHVLKLGILDDIYVSNSLLSMLFKCGAIEDAVQLFQNMRERDQVSWNALIVGFQQLGCFGDSLKAFGRMIWEFGVYPNRVASVSVLSSCASLRSLIHGRELHCFTVKSGLNVDEFVVNGLIDMYMKCRLTMYAERVFRNHIGNDLVQRGNVIIWNVMILGYVSNGCSFQALDLFIELLMLGIRPDSSTMVALLVLCSHLKNVVVGRQIHGLIFSLGLDNDVRVQTALLDMYFKCGASENGLEVFERFQSHNIVMWGAVISNCAQSSHPMRALEFFCVFRSFYGAADSIIFLAALRACSSLSLFGVGAQIHCLVMKMGLDSNVFIGGALVDMYAKSEDVESAEKVFLGLLERDLISWNAMISVYSQNGHANKALKAFRAMQSEKIRPNSVTVAYILSLCAYISALNLCTEVHGLVMRNGLEVSVLVSNSLLACYAKCGDLNSSCVIFERMAERNEVSCNSIIQGFGIHGRVDEMFALFNYMIASGMKPSHITFTAILSACSHAGRVEEGWGYFKSMVEVYKLKPRLEQYTCMVDLLGRAGHLNQAYDLIMAMPYDPDDRIWGSLLGSCKSHGNRRLAEEVSSEIFKLDPNSIGYRILLSNLYEKSGKWNEVARVRSEIKDMGLKKWPGCSWIEIDRKVQAFIAGDKSHYLSEDIYKTLENLTMVISEAGYVPLLHQSAGEFEMPQHDCLEIFADVHPFAN